MAAASWLNRGLRDMRDKTILLDNHRKLVYNGFYW